MLQQDSNVISRINYSTLAELILKDAQEALRNNQSTVNLYQLPIGDVEVFIQVIQPPVPLVIFGAGHDAIPVVRFAKELGWHVTVVDSRQSAANSTRFLAADAVVSRPEDIGRITLDPRTVAVVMTHNYLQDQELLKTLLPSSVRYVGILGPKSRTERLLRELLEQGVILTKNNLNRLYAPVGLDIGADNPEEIALAIMAEIRAAIANRCGGFLRDRQGSIHNQTTEDNDFTTCVATRQGIVLHD